MDINKILIYFRSAAAAEKYKAKLAAGGKGADVDSGSEEEEEEDTSGRKKKKKGGQQQKKPETQIIFQVGRSVLLNQTAIYNSRSTFYMRMTFFDASFSDKS